MLKAAFDPKKRVEESNRDGPVDKNLLNGAKKLPTHELNLPPLKILILIPHPLLPQHNYSNRQSSRPNGAQHKKRPIPHPHSNSKVNIKAERFVGWWETYLHLAEWRHCLH